MFGRTSAGAVLHPSRDLVKPGVRFVQATITAIDPTARRAETDAGVFEADIMVVARRADLHPTATPGLVEGGHDIVGVASTPFKRPPAPSETALLVHDFLAERGLRDRSEISMVMPLGVPIPPSPAHRRPCSRLSPTGTSTGFRSRW